MLTVLQHVAVSAMDGMLSNTIWTQDKINVPAGRYDEDLAAGRRAVLPRSLAPRLEYHMWEGVSDFLMSVDSW